MITEETTHHELKIKKDYAKDIISGIKKAEVRDNDRNFKVGDFIYFTVVGSEGKCDPTNSAMPTYRITHIFRGTGEYGLKQGFCVLSIEEVKNVNNK